MIKASIIISVYKNACTLKAILCSLERQTCQDFEVIISEDGQSQEIKAVVDSYAFQWPYQHITQEDYGWRKEVILNKSVLAAQSDWLIFIDGDCILHPRFVEYHIRYKSPKTILAGKRIKLSNKVSEKFLKGHHICWISYLFAHRGCRFVEEVFFLRIAQWIRRPVKHLVGSNMSMSRQDLLDINGFDENYIRPATGEDYDIEWRLLANGCKIVSLRNLAIQYHIYHHENWQDHIENMKYCKWCQEKHQIICKNGIKKYN